MTPVFDFAACTIHLTTPANRPSRGVGGGQWCGGGGEESKGIIQAACPRPAFPVCAQTMLLCSHHSLPRGVTVWRDEACFLMVSLIPPTVSSNICITPSPSTQFWQVLHQHLLPEVCPIQASPSSSDRASRRSSPRPSPSASSQLGVPGPSAQPSNELGASQEAGVARECITRAIFLPLPPQNDALVTSSTTSVICLGEPPYLQQTQEGLEHNRCRTAPETR